MAKKDEAGKHPGFRLNCHYDAAPEAVWQTHESQLR